MIGIIDYKAGNIGSVQNALNRLGFEYFLSNGPEKLKEASKIIFPGVGAASAAMESLKESGLDIYLKETNQDVLGICLGLQLLYEFTEEGNVSGLDIVEGKIIKFKDEGLVVPQIGWNKVQYQESNNLFKGIEQDSYFYFVHSFYALISRETISTSDYGVTYTSAIKKDNFYAVQVHPEKSGAVGEKLLKNFINL